MDAGTAIAAFARRRPGRAGCVLLLAACLCPVRAGAAGTAPDTAPAVPAAEPAALGDERVQRALEGKAPRKVIVVPNRIVNVVA